MREWVIPIKPADADLTSVKCFPPLEKLNQSLNVWSTLPTHPWQVSHFSIINKQITDKIMFSFQIRSDFLFQSYILHVFDNSFTYKFEQFSLKNWMLLNISLFVQKSPFDVVVWQRMTHLPPQTNHAAPTPIFCTYQHFYWRACEEFKTFII